MIYVVCRVSLHYGSIVQSLHSALLLSSTRCCLMSISAVSSSPLGYFYAGDDARKIYFFGKNLFCGLLLTVGRRECLPSRYVWNTKCSKSISILLVDWFVLLAQAERSWLADRTPERERERALKRRSSLAFDGARMITFPVVVLQPSELFRVYSQLMFWSNVQCNKKDSLYHLGPGQGQIQVAQSL